ncbi:MAG: tRNA pseudouridine(13) synthase TruD [Candidatus Nanoarchaeia archaeon]
MYTLKKEPEDFIVEEITRVKPSNGMYAYFRLKKRDYGLYKVLGKLSKAWKVSVSSFGYAGMKDKRAVTYQLCSVKGVPKHIIEGTKLQDIEIEHVGQGPQPIRLGDLIGNKFIITVRDASSPKWKSTFVNYYGEQRFGESNAEIGKALVKKDYAGVVELLKKTNAEHLWCVEEHLAKNPKDYVGALGKVSPMALLFYVHAYQAKLWNEAVALYLEKHPEENLDLEVGQLGFGYEDGPLELIYAGIMRRECINERDFINRQLSHLSAEGVKRKVWIKAGGFDAEKVDNTYRVMFTLPRGSYATELIRQSFQDS